MKSKTLIEISLNTSNPGDRTPERGAEIDRSNEEGERACKLLTTAGIPAYWEYPGYISIPNDQEPGQPDSEYGYGALICGTINGDWECQVSDETGDFPSDAPGMEIPDFGQIPLNSTAEDIASMLIGALPNYRKWWAEYRKKRDQVSEGRYGRNDFSIHTDKEGNMPFLRWRGSRRPLPNSHPYYTTYRNNKPDRAASKFHPNDVKVYNYATGEFEPISSNPVPSQMGESRKSIRLSKVKELYHDCLVTKFVESGEMEGTPEEIDLKAGDVILLPATDGGTTPDQLDMYDVLPDLPVREAIGKKLSAKLNAKANGADEVSDNKKKFVRKYNPSNQKVGKWKSKSYKEDIDHGEGKLFGNNASSHASDEAPQSLPNGTVCTFKMREWGRDFEELSPGISAHDGDTCKIVSLETATEMGEKDFEYYNIKFEDGSEFTGISGYHLFPNHPESSASLINNLMELDDNPGKNYKGSGDLPFSAKIETPEERRARASGEMKQYEVNFFPLKNLNLDPETEYLIHVIAMDSCYPEKNPDVASLTVDELVSAKEDYYEHGHPEMIQKTIDALMAAGMGYAGVQVNLRESLDGARSFQAVMSQFQQLDHNIQRRLRHCASNYLVQNGAEEVGSSDINHALVSLFNMYAGEWDEVLRDYEVDDDDSLGEPRDPLAPDDFAEIPSHDDAYIARVDNRLLDPRDL